MAKGKKETKKPEPEKKEAEPRSRTRSARKPATPPKDEPKKKEPKPKKEVEKPKKGPEKAVEKAVEKADKAEKSPKKDSIDKEPKASKSKRDASETPAKKTPSKVQQKPTPASKKAKGKTTEKKADVTAEKPAVVADASANKMDVQKNENSNAADGGDSNPPAINAVTDPAPATVEATKPVEEPKATPSSKLLADVGQESKKSDMEIEDGGKVSKKSSLKEPKSPEKKPEASDMQVEDPVVNNDQPANTQANDNNNKEAEQAPADSMITM